MMVVSDQVHTSAALRPGKIPRHPLYWKLGGSQSQSELCGTRKILLPRRKLIPDSLVVQPWSSHYGDRAMPATDAHRLTYRCKSDHTTDRTITLRSQKPFILRLIN
jgi:hypothetical protein